MGHDPRQITCDKYYHTFLLPETFVSDDAQSLPHGSLLACGSHCGKIDKRQQRSRRLLRSISNMSSFSYSGPLFAYRPSTNTLYQNRTKTWRGGVCVYSGDWSAYATQIWLQNGPAHAWAHPLALNSAPTASTLMITFSLADWVRNVFVVDILTQNGTDKQTNTHTLSVYEATTKNIELYRLTGTIATSKRMPVTPHTGRSGRVGRNKRQGKVRHEQLHASTVKWNGPTDGDIRGARTKTVTLQRIA